MNDYNKWFKLCNAKLVNYIPRGSAYIVPDGRFADLGKSGYRTHGALDLALLDNGYPVDIEEPHYLLPIEFMNCVRVNDGKNFLSEVVVDLPIDRVSSDQLDSIEKYLENLPTPVVTVGCTLKNVHQVYDLNEISAYDVRKKIRNLF
jgi:hypothetical protein